LTDDVLKLLTALQECQREGNPYVFVPTPRYDHIQELRKTGKWTVEKGRCPLNNFTREFNKIRTLAGIDYGEFHDLRRTCLSNWLENGLSEFDVMTLAGHSKFETTRRFYLAIRKDLIDRARVISEQTEEDNLLRACCAPLQRDINAKELTNVNACQPLSCINEAEGARTLNLRIDSPTL
jgi:integrase